MRKPVVLIMAKAPRFGAVKRRLAASIGTGRAWVFYRRTLFRTARKLARESHWRLYIQATPDRLVRLSRQWPRTSGLLKQGRGNIGERMERGLTGVPRGTPVVLIGSDIPDVTAAHIRRAVRALGLADAVFGPATDGGFWLVGFANRRPLNRPFAGVRWSTSNALKDTLRNFQGRRVVLTDTLSDVDDGRALRAIFPSGAG